jgi:hypothetical protein
MRRRSLRLRGGEDAGQIRCQREVWHPAPPLNHETHSGNPPPRRLDPSSAAHFRSAGPSGASTQRSATAKVRPCGQPFPVAAHVRGQCELDP